MLDPVDDLPPATIILSIRQRGGKLLVRGVSHDNGDIVSINVNGTEAQVLSTGSGAVDWQAELTLPGDGKLIASAKDRSGNVEQTGHETNVATQAVAIAERRHS